MEIFFIVQSEPFQSCFDRHAFTGSKINLGQFYFANGTYADLWHGYIEDDIPAVAVKVWRGVKLSRNTLLGVEKVRKLDLYLHTHLTILLSQRLLKRLDDWQSCEHVNIVPFLGLLHREGHIPSLVIPYYENGDVIRYLKRNPTADRLQLVSN